MSPNSCWALVLPNNNQGKIPLRHQTVEDKKGHNLMRKQEMQQDEAWRRDLHILDHFRILTRWFIEVDFFYKWRNLYPYQLPINGGTIVILTWKSTSIVYKWRNLMELSRCIFIQLHQSVGSLSLTWPRVPTPSHVKWVIIQWILEFLSATLSSLEIKTLEDSMEHLQNQHLLPPTKFQQVHQCIRGMDCIQQ